MQKRDSYPPGVPCWIDATHPDAGAAAAFYGDLLGWTYEDRMPGEAHYFVAQLDGLDAAGFAEGGSSAWLTYVSVEDADAAAARVREAGGSVTLEPQDVMDLGRTAIFTDPAGAAFAVWQPGRRAGLGVVNAPGSWNWSNLHARDLDGAARFYGAVFGWEATTIELGPGMESTMFRLPGYGDFLAERDPGLRERHADPSVPPGFSDAVAWVEPLAADGPPRWHVTFSAADTDAVVARAAELGGEILHEPFDAGPVRMATLRDPQGAAFSVNTYAPGAGG
jgi:predicted enzyme related to lactoylglutathione lyase